jgi:hypothetical protein
LSTNMHQFVHAEPIHPTALELSIVLIVTSIMSSPFIIVLPLRNSYLMMCVVCLVLASSLGYPHKKVGEYMLFYYSLE